LVLTYNHNNAAPDTFDLHFGLWSYQTWSSVSNSAIIEGCRFYPDYVEIDSQWKAARSFSIMALVLGAGIVMAKVISMCKKDVGEIRVSPFTGATILLCSLFSSLSLLFLGSDVCKDNQLSEEFFKSFPDIDMSLLGCSISTGANCIIASTTLYFVAGAAAIRAYKIGDDADNDIIDSSTVSIEPLLMGFDEFNSLSTKWLMGEHPH
jgi:hypothetical protein